MDLDKLTPKAKAIRILIGDEIPDGYALNEIANELGQPPTWVAQRLNELRNELLLQTGRFFPLADHEYQALEASCLTHGIQTPIILGQHIPCIDGHHRALIAQQHHLEAPAIFLTNLDPEQERELSLALNTARRQLNRAQKRQLIEHELHHNPARSDRLIATICGVHNETVAATRADLAEKERRAQLTKTVTITAPTDTIIFDHTTRASADPPTRIDARGHTQRRPEPPPPRPPTTEQDRPLGHAPCAHGQRHAIYRNGPGYRLEGQ